MAGIGVLLVLGAVYEALLSAGILPISIVAALPFLTAGPLALLAALTAVAGSWLVLKGLRGLGDMLVTAQSVVLPGRSVIQIARGVPNVIPISRILSIRTVVDPSPGKVEIRYRLAGGRERRTSISLGFVPDLEAFRAELGIRGVRLVGGSP